VSSVERSQVSMCRPNAVIELSPWATSITESDDMPMTIRFKRCTIIDKMLAGDCDA
jgi:hypothetical protein